jgi:Transposase
VLGVGIDWAETFHVVALGRPGEGVVQVLRVEHSKPALEALLEQLRALEPDSDQVRVVLETRHGLLVERLVEAGFVVVPVNPDLIARRRGPAKKKDDVEDARIACLLALDRFQPLRPLIPHGELAAEQRLLGRDDERACQDEGRLLNRLRADLLAVFPAAVKIAGLGQGLLRQPTRSRQGPSHRAPRPRQPLAGDPLALPPAPGSLCRSRPARQPHPDPAPSRLILQPYPDWVGSLPAGRDGAADQGAPWTAGAGGGGNGTDALVEDRGRPQRL